jgi:hypothetical protein
MSTTPPRKRAVKKTAAAPAPEISEDELEFDSSQLGVTPVSEFKKKTLSRRGVLTLPSGVRVRAVSPGMSAFITRGLIPNPLLQVIQESLDTGKDVDAERLMKEEDGEVNHERMAELMGLVDSVTCEVMVEPKCYRVPTEKDLRVWNQQHPDDRKKNPEDLRSPQKLYVDEVDDLDKMFLWQWSVGGTEKLSQFREELEADLGTVAAGQGSSLPAKRAPRARAK